MNDKQDASERAPSKTQAGATRVWPASATSAAHASGAARCRRLKLHHRQGELQFFLSREGVGLYVERQDVPKRGPRTIQALHFTGTVEFERWCDEDTLRFDHPQLYVTLRREGERLWQLDASAARD